MENLPKVLLVSNAKTIYWHPLPLMCYQQDVFIIEKKNRTYVIRCGVWEDEIYLDQIREYV
ncbi:hypothetical protein [Beduini massiliensis]|uniref:hypothetical protein n=1 Tax=Beduini massiliensis TaxID=1585974 RepID=UPI00059A8E2F|nr:hypothetical protein [Beduini massiliensis]